MNPRTPTGQPPQGCLDYWSVRDEFLMWLKAKNVTEGHVHKITSYLDRFFKPINSPSDVSKMFIGLSRGQKENLVKALRNLFNFLELKGFNQTFLDLLRRGLPKTGRGFDVRVPSEEDIVNALRVLQKYDGYFMLFNVILDSGLRVIEAVKFMEAYKAGVINLEAYGGFYMAKMSMMRGCKNTFAVFITEYTRRLLDGVERIISYERARKMKEQLGLKDSLISCKYLRKFAFDKMVELGIPESVADFIQGRTPVKICAKHYMNLLKQATTHYPRYMEYLRALREKADLHF